LRLCALRFAEPGVSDPRRRIGAAGERLAAAHLEQLDYEVRDCNARRREGEVDFIAVDSTQQEPVLVSVEVKLRRPRATGREVEALLGHKQTRLRALAEVYASEHCLLRPVRRAVPPHHVR